MVLDDFRSEHTPGVSVAAWEAVLNRGLRPICLSTQKLYGTWGDPEPLQEKLLAMIKERDDFGLSVQMAAGHRLIRTRSQGMKPPPFPRSRHYVEPVPEPVPAPVSAAGQASVRPAARGAGRSRTRRIALDLLPPVVTRAVRRSRAAKRAERG